ncbi:MAG: hypothetical protein DA328_09335 [Nitrososphaeraceae archaeon]|nr:hypothetical protein [Nitrososphaeraceae archaeon]
MLNDSCRTILILISDDGRENKNYIHSNKEHLEYFNRSLLDDGQIAFMQWLNSEDRTSVNNPLILKKYENTKSCTIYDNPLDLEIKVNMDEGIPICKYCNSDNCAHVGFAISIMQLYDRKEILIEDTELLDLFE